MKALRAWFVCLATALTFAAGTHVSALQSESADPELERMVKEVSEQLRCVVCQGLSIQDSPSELARQMRDVVREQLAAGKSPDEVKAYFVSSYGEWVLLKPKASGLNLMVYILPIALFVGGGVFVYVQARRWTDGRVTSQPANGPADDTD